MFAEVEFRSVIRFLVLRKFKTKDIIFELVEAYGDSCPSQTTIYSWVSQFKGGRNSVFDEKSTGRPTEIQDSKKEDLKNIVLSERKITTRELCDTLNVSAGTLQSMLAALGLRKLCSRFVPMFLSNEMCTKRLECCLSNLSLLHDFGEDFLNNIVTMDESPLSLYVPVSKRESREWKFPGERASRMLKSSLNHRKVSMLTVYWDVSGTVTVECSDNKSLNSLYYCSVMKEARKSRRKPTNQDLWLLQDNAPIHNSNFSTSEIEKSGFKLLPHPPYSPDLAPSDFYLFAHLKRYLRGAHFNSKCDVENAVNEFFASQTPLFYKTGFVELAKRWQKCVDAKGGYIEK